MIYFFYFIIIISILLNVLVLFLDVLPSIYPRLLRKLRPVETLKVINSNFERTILDTAIKMANSNKVTMVWEDRTETFTQKFLNLFRKKNSPDEFRKYNYPRAFLLLGILSYIIKIDDKDGLKNFKQMFGDYITDSGIPKFSINRVDQGTFGIVALILYDKFKEEKYLRFCKDIYEYIIQNVDTEIGVINYRKGSTRVFNDMLGFTVPFLLEYGKEINDESIIKLAKRQIEYYISFGIDSNTHIPSHGIYKQNNMQIGSANWGRGIGWYFLSLAWYNKYYKDFEDEINELQKSLMQIRNKENVWTQFPGSSYSFDASTTTIFLYSILLTTPSFLDSKEVLNLLKNYISTDGYILKTSGDTYTLNDYSKTFGKSELSQGFLLLILSTFKKSE